MRSSRQDLTDGARTLLDLQRIGKEIVKYRAKKRMEGKVDDKATANQTVFRA